MKNKRILMVFMVVLLSFSMIVGCQPRQGGDTGQGQGQDQGGYQDGTYSAELDRNERGWQATVEVVVEGGQITEVNYDEINEDGERKSEAEEYNQAWESAAGISAPEAYEQLQQSLIETQDVEKVDTVSGATQATEDFKNVVRQALEQ